MRLTDAKIASYGSKTQEAVPMQSRGTPLPAGELPSQPARLAQVDIGRLAAQGGGSSDQASIAGTSATVGTASPGIRGAEKGSGPLPGGE